ncbi:MAG TPA: hypothetical protein V6C88_01520 [Chroococcidiopsis sp.]
MAEAGSSLHQSHEWLQPNAIARKHPTIALAGQGGAGRGRIVKKTF